MMEAAAGCAPVPATSREYRAAMAEFMSDDCPTCHGKKQRRQSFCRSCYRALPRTMAQNLWLRFGAGYVTAYGNAKQWLQGRAA